MDKDEDEDKTGLQAAKKGDSVSMFYGLNLHDVVEISKCSKKFLHAGGSRWRRKDGSLLEKDAIIEWRIKPATKEHKKAAAHKKIIYTLEHANWNLLTEDELRIVADIESAATKRWFG